MPPSVEVPHLKLVERRPRIAIMADRRDMHAGSLARHLKRLGAEPRRLSLIDCAFDTRRPFGIDLPGFVRRLPDAVLVRSIPAGSFEAVTRRLGILHALRELGVPVWNDARAVERCVDKSTTTFFLARAGIATPPTWTVERPADAADIVRREAMQGPLVLKPLFGSQGRGLRLVHTVDELPTAEEVQGVYYLQRFMGEDRGGYHDYRVFVVAGQAIAGMRRVSSSWITNVKQGARPEAVALDSELSGLAARAAAAVGADFCGVDILRHAPGRAVVLEVNSMPAWSGLQKVTETSISGTIAAALLDALRADTLRRAAS